MGIAKFTNPYRPGAGHMPTYLAGREHETKEFRRLLDQQVVMHNLVITGLRGVGKTVLLETLKPIAIASGWLWVGTDLSESASLSETNIVVRMLADLSLVTSSMKLGKVKKSSLGFAPSAGPDHTLAFETLVEIYQNRPGLASDKIKAVLETVALAVRERGDKGIVFAYDESQNMSDHAEKEEYPLSLMLDVFQSLQRQGIPFMIVLAGLPTMLAKLVDARTYSKRMFHVLMLDRLNEEDSRAAILKPIADAKCPVRFNEPGIQSIIAASGGYPYFIQFICRELYDAYLQSDGKGIPVSEAVRKLDSDFFMGRWARVTDRQKQLLWVVANLENSDGEFTVQEVAAKSKEMLEKPFSASHISQMFSTLGDAALIYRNRHGRYSFAVPMLDQFIHRQAGPKQDWAQ
jgi:hypothetical protein